MKRTILFSAIVFSCFFGTAFATKNAIAARTSQASQSDSAAVNAVADANPAAPSSAASSIEGYWQIVEKTAPEAIAIVYQQDGVHYIRMVALYDDAGDKITETISAPEEKAKGLAGNPYLCGLDFVWGLKPESDGKTFKGKVTDPDSGSSYTCEVWFDQHKNKLIVRGELLVFGENQYWPSIKEEDVPEAARLNIEKIKLNLPQS